MRICLIGSSKHPIAEPFHGGLEAHTAALATGLRERGHELSIFAAPGSDPALGATHLAAAPFEASPAARADVNAPSDEWMREHHAYLALMLDLVGPAGDRFDVVHNNSLHHLPIAMAPAGRARFVTTLHTPPLGHLESAITLAPDGSSYVAVSRHTAESWSHVVRPQVVLNGVDTRRWRAGPGGDRAIWTGRIVPEKAPHVAIDAARRAGLELDLAGPVHDQHYFDTEVAPRLGPDVRHAGHLGTDELVRAVGTARVAIVSPRWDEPYGLVAAEAMSCGTPVAAFARGALPEIVSRTSGRLAAPDDVEALGRAVHEAGRLDRRAVREHAETSCDVRSMVSAYEDLYVGLTQQESRP